MFKLPESIALLLVTIGLAMIIAALTGKVAVKEIEFGSNNPLARVALGFLGTLLSIVSIYSFSIHSIPDGLKTPCSIKNDFYVQVYFHNDDLKARQIVERISNLRYKVSKTQTDFKEFDKTLPGSVELKFPPCLERKESRLDSIATSLKNLGYTESTNLLISPFKDDEVQSIQIYIFDK